MYGCIVVTIPSESVNKLQRRSKMEAKRKRVGLSLSDKVKLIKLLKEKEVTGTDIAKILGISQ